MDVEEYEARRAKFEESRKPQIMRSVKLIKAFDKIFEGCSDKDKLMGALSGCASVIARVYSKCRAPEGFKEEALNEFKRMVKQGLPVDWDDFDRQYKDIK